MIKHLTEWLRTDTPLSGGAYAFIGITAFAIKFNIDRLFAKLVFHRPWNLLDYWRGGNAFYLWDLHRQDALFFASMLALAIPFIAFGVTMTLRRLTAMRAWRGWIVVFFLPVANLFFFIILAFAGEVRGYVPAARAQISERVGHWIPSSVVGSCLLSAACVSILGGALVSFDVMILKQYGWSLFVLLPFVHGMMASWLYGFHQRRSLGGSQLVAGLSCVLTAAYLMSFAIEGAICIVMAAPLWLTLSGIGAWAGWEIHEAHWKKNQSGLFMLFCALTVPLLMGAEFAVKPKAPLLEARTALEIKAPPTMVWNHVVAFSELPAPKELVFKTGLAYPIRARIEGSGVGAMRHCIFSTGEFLEPILVWDQPNLLRFSVINTPSPMEEMSLYSHIEPPHLHGYMVSRKGQFLLTRLPDGGTRLEGTTWYEHNLWPASYWQLWSDFIIHQIHLRVLRHIKALAEKDVEQGVHHG